MVVWIEGFCQTNTSESGGYLFGAGLQVPGPTNQVYTERQGSVLVPIYNRSTKQRYRRYDTTVSVRYLENSSQLAQATVT